jgi:steroid 5-alpha reductase family enzyme
MLNLILYSAFAVFLYMTLIFAIAQIKKDNSIVDITWGPGFILVSVLTLLISQKFELRQVLSCALVVIWGTRLAVHIAVRNRGRGEDYRYAKWRKDWGKWFYLRSFFQIFMLQGVILLVVVYPVILINHASGSGIRILDIIGALIWLIGFSFEAISDYQLLKFKKHPENKGKIITHGLWKYTRHPNYFGETLIWWGLFVIALSVRNGWSALMSPLLITFMLIRVSGVTMLEKKYAGNKDFEEYARRTSPFIPWFPKKI